MTRARDLSNDEANGGGATPPIVAGKNKIINGDFGVWARGTSSFTSAYTSDRWYTDAFSVVSRSTDVPSGQPFTYSLKHTAITVNSALRHAVELPAVGQLGIFKIGTTWTLSFWTKTTAPRLVKFYAAFTIGNGGTPEATPVNAVTLGTSGTNTWQQWSYTFVIPAGTTLTSANCFQITPFIEGNGVAIDSFITGIQLEAGSVSTPFTTASGTIGGELSLCERYYQKTYPADVVPGTNTQNGLVNYVAVTSTAINNRCWVPFKTTMRTATPTITTYSVSGSANTATNEVSGNYNIAIQFQSEKSFTLYPTSGTFAAGNICNFHYVASAEL